MNDNNDINPESNLYNLSRRKVLAGMGAVGLASAGAGLGTSALFSDTESFEDNVITAGTLDLLVDYYSYWDQDIRGTGTVSGTADGPTVTAVLDDMKPGDSGLLGFCFRIDDNPAYIWHCGALTENAENDQNEAEANHSDDTSLDVGELADAIEVSVDYCDIAEDLDANATPGFDPGDVSPGANVFQGTLAEFLAAGENGIPLDGSGAAGVLAPGEQAAFAGLRQADADNPCLCISWEIPVEVGNEIQSDSVMFDLEFYAEQARNNDGTNNPCIDAAAGAGWGDAGFDPAFFGRVRNGGGGWELAVGNGNGPGDDDNADYNWPGSTFDGSFDLVYDGAGSAVLTLYDGAGTQVQSVGYGDDGGESLNQANGDELAITVSANSGQLARVENVTFDGGSPGVDAVESTGSTANLVVSSIATAGGFTLAGDIEFQGLGGGSDERPSMTVHVE